MTTELNVCQQQTTDTERKLAAMGISSSADFADDFDEPELQSQVIAPARARTPSPSFQSAGPPPSYDSATRTKKVWRLRFENNLDSKVCSETLVPSPFSLLPSHPPLDSSLFLT